MGELEVDGGTFIAYDLEESGIYGKYYITGNGGLLEIYNDGWIDLNGQIVISDGTMNVYGGSGLASAIICSKCNNHNVWWSS